MPGPVCAKQLQAQHKEVGPLSGRTSGVFLCLLHWFKMFLNCGEVVFGWGFFGGFVGFFSSLERDKGLI